MPKTRIAIVYHSGYGHTQRQAEAVRDGVGEVPGAEVLLLTIKDAQRRWDDLAAAEAIIFGAPTYVGSVSAAFKAFQEASSRLVMTNGFKWKDKIAAGFTNSGSRSGDKLATLFQLALFAAQHGMHWVNLALPPANHSSMGSERELNRMGFWLGAAAQSNVDQGPDIAPPEADLATARHLGRRVAEVTLQFVRGRDFLEHDFEKLKSASGPREAFFDRRSELGKEHATAGSVEQALELEMDAVAGRAAVPGP